MAEKRHNLVTFRPAGGGARIFLKLEGKFTLSVGMTPNVNRAVVPFSEFEKLKSGSAFSDAGTVEFWFSASPASGGSTPDHAISGVSIIDVEPLQIGTIKGQASPCVVEYRLYLADLRQRFLPPQGRAALAGGCECEGHQRGGAQAEFRIGPGLRAGHGPGAQRLGPL